MMANKIHFYVKGLKDGEKVLIEVTKVQRTIDLDQCQESRQCDAVVLPLVCLLNTLATIEPPSLHLPHGWLHINNQYTTVVLF